MGVAKLDDMDLRILRALQREPSLSIADLASKVGLSHTPCWRRIRRMETDGIIEGRTLVLNAELLGYPISVFAEIGISSHDEKTIAAFEASIQQHPEIVECFSMSGESDFLLRIVSASVADYEAFLKRTLLHLPGIGSVNSRFALKSVKLTSTLPL
jgi:Lrp/AsnC family transcriptional regulator